MSTEKFSETSLAALADALSDPARIAAARREQQRRRDAEAAQARDAALQRMPQLQAHEAAAEKQRAEALNEMRAAEALVEQRRSAVFAADESLRIASRAVANLHREISLVHGGAAVEMALTRLGQAVAAQRQKIVAIEAIQWDLKYAADGVTVIWRSLKPAEAARMRPAKDRLSELEAAQKAVLALVHQTGQSPAALQRKAAAALEPLGIPNADLLDQPQSR